MTKRSNIQLLVFEEYYQKQFEWTNSEYGKIDWWIFNPVHRGEKNKHLKWANKFFTRKLPVGQQIHARESKYDKQCCSCWTGCKTDDHLPQCLKQTRYRNEIYQVIKRLGKEMNPVLQDILLDGVTKYLTGTR